ncbi:hypothetical protein Btru_062644 [Bulinus truncatus]|nr:hypothetical protein Btru_062644 [Bulinus truncatus]
MAAEFLREHQFIVDVMSACTHDVSMEVRFEYLRPLLVDIFPRMTLSRDEGHGRASCEIMINICDSAKRLSKDDFVKFVDAIHKDHPTSAQLIRNKYKEISGKDLPSFPSQPQRVPVVQEVTPVHCHADIQARSNHRVQASNIPAPAVTIPAQVTKPQLQFTDKALPVYKLQQLPLIDTNPDDVYLMESTPRGRALIINNMIFDVFSERKGSDVDVRLFRKMFDKLKFETRVEENKKAWEMDQIFKQFAKDSQLKNVSAISIVILTHGGANDCYFGVDGKIFKEHGKNKPVNCITKVDLAKIVQLQKLFFHMKGKNQKLFIIQACRGEDENESYTQNVPTTG